VWYQEWVVSRLNDFRQCSNSCRLRLHAGPHTGISDGAEGTLSGPPVQMFIHLVRYLLPFCGPSACPSPEISMFHLRGLGDDIHGPPPTWAVSAAASTPLGPDQVSVLLLWAVTARGHGSRGTTGSTPCARHPAAAHGSARHPMGV
jgi:hypothetical protein